MNYETLTRNRIVLFEKSSFALKFVNKIIIGQIWGFT
jgi:hypothetical protein